VGIRAPREPLFLFSPPNFFNKLLAFPIRNWQSNKAQEKPDEHQIAQHDA
jgi:hypothetical protein